MTTKPRAQKFRIRRNAPLNANPNPEQGVQDEQGVVSGDVSDPHEVETEQSIDDIRKEGLTGRQLRMARRVAQKYGLAPTSDFDAIRLLRAKGIDPFQRSNMLELEAPKDQQQDRPAQLPQTIPAGQANLPSTEVDTAGVRAKEIIAIQRDIAKRRRRKLAFLLSRLAFFVMLPTLMVGYYYYVVATPMFATKSEFVIQKANSQGGDAGMGGLLGGMGLATSQDSVAVQSYLQSRGAMLRLDQDHGFKTHFSQDWIDPIQHLAEDATNEAAYKLYQRRINISYDPTEGIIKMEVVAADPAVSATYSNALISYAEEQVDHMTARLRDDQMKGAQTIFTNAETAMLAAQQDVLQLQKTSSVLSVEIEVSLLTGQIQQLELLQTQDELNLVELNSNARPNLAKLKPLQRRIKARSDKIAKLRAQLTEGAEGAESIADINAKLARAQINLETRTMMMQQALQQMDTAQVEAHRQTRYLSMGVSPIPPDEPTYPRKFENTILAFLIFAGAYLMMSLTASILREQVSA